MGHGAGKPLAPIVPGNRLRLGRGGLVPHPPRTGRRRSAEPGRAVPPSLPPSLLLSFPPSLPRSAPVCRAAGRHGPARPGPAASGSSSGWDAEEKAEDARGRLGLSREGIFLCRCYSCGYFYGRCVRCVGIAVAPWFIGWILGSGEW